jgi:glycosyltransferase involved in cell wall biosynthesis
MPERCIFVFDFANGHADQKNIEGRAARRMMKALVISPQPFFTPRGTPLSVYYRALIMSQLGVKIDLLTYGQGKDVDIPNVRIIRIPHLPFLGKVRIGPSLVKLILDIILFFRTLSVLAANRYDFVHAHEEAAFFCLALKPIFGFKLVYDMHSSLPQQLVNFNFTRSRPIISLFTKMEDCTIKAADIVITICPDLESHARRIAPETRKHVMIENSIFDPVQLKNEPKAADVGMPAALTGDLFFQKALKTGKLVTYVGSLEPYQGIDLLLNAFREAVRKCTDAFLLIVGGDERQAACYADMARLLGIGAQTFFTGGVSQHMARKYTAISSVLVSPRSTGNNTPLKLYEQMASGIPLVATAIRSHTQILSPEIAILVPPEPGAMADGIIRALDPGGPGRKIAANASKQYREQYDTLVYAEKIRRILRELAACAE